MSDAEVPNTSAPATRIQILARILELEAACEEFEKKAATAGKRRARIFGKLQKFALHMVFGRQLTESLGELLHSVKSGKRPYLGQELAKTLDAASRKLIGYKRWLFALGALAALPGIVSMVLLWQQNLAVAKAKDDKISDIENSERVILLTTIYTTFDKSEAGMLTTPFYSAVNRREAALRLIERDGRELKETEEADILGLNRMVDLSIAPFNGVDFSAAPGVPPTQFSDVSFVNSNLEEAIFENCEFRHAWFSFAYLWRTNFRKARFVNTSFDNASILGADFTGATFDACDFTEAVYDKATRWPDGFDPVAAGAKKIESVEGAAQ